MQAKDLISDVIPAIHINETGLKALNWMEIFRISHLPVIDDNNNLIGIISDNNIFDFDLTEKKISSFTLSLTRTFILSKQHLFEIIDLFSRHKLTMIPVLNNKNKYLGVITLHDLIHQFAKITAVGSLGVIFVLKIGKFDYSLSQIAHIIESNGAKIVSLYVSNPDDINEISITLKINTTDFSAIHQTFERYGYEIKASYSRKDKVNEMLDEKYDEFLTYLNI